MFQQRVNSPVDRVCVAAGDLDVQPVVLTAMQKGSLHHAGNGAHSFQQFVEVHRRPTYSKASGQSDDVPRYVPVWVYRTFQVGRREPAAPVRTQISLSITWTRSEEHTSELQSPCNLVCRLLL